MCDDEKNKGYFVKEMKYEEAIKWIDTKMCFGRYTPQMHNPFVEDDCYKAGKMAAEALESADRYKWHDLRKDPKDLPEEDMNVGYLIFAESDGISEYLVSKFYGYGEVCQGFREFPEGVWEANGFGREVIAWREIQPLEE